jgi:DtxR family Mn-dependent transcriptional regulator
MGADMKKKLSSNMEDYLEAVAILKKKNGVARVKDISKNLNVRTSSVTSALNTLSKHGFVNHERYGYVELTKEGEDLAQHIQRRHNMLIKFLTNILHINPRIASADACEMEHTLSPETFEKLTKFIEFVETCPDGERPDWLQSFDYYFKTGKRRKCRIRNMKQRFKAA